MPLPVNQISIPTAESLGFSKDVAPWLGVEFKEGNSYTNPVAGLSKSRVHTHVRQVRVVVVKLRERLDKINEEIKILLKVSLSFLRKIAFDHFERNHLIRL